MLEKTISINLKGESKVEKNKYTVTGFNAYGVYRRSQGSNIPGS
jgi:hypothetical protein